MASKGPVEEATQAAGESKDTNPKNPSTISSGGAVGKQFNPDGNVGQVGEKIGGPFSKVRLKICHVRHVSMRLI
jgi:hypothetical protein